MTSIAPEFAPIQAKPRWQRFGRWKLIVFALPLVVCEIGFEMWRQGFPLSCTADYDRVRYDEIRWAIDADPKHLLGTSFDEFSRQMRLDAVPWDDAAIQQEPGMFRIYHFRGFALYVTLSRLPPGTPPDTRVPMRARGQELDHHEVLWFAHQYPYVIIDGVSEGKERMRRYWKAYDDECERINRINAAMRKPRR